MSTLRPVKTSEQVSGQKLRGGFYTPEPLVRFCLERLRTLIPPRKRLSLVEPSAGDGAFLRGLADHSNIGGRLTELVAIEPFELEAKKCRKVLAQTTIDATVHVDTAVRWGAETEQLFDAAVGNPPFVRYQFISATDKAQIPALGARAGVSFAGVSNLWLPVLVAALSRLKPGGAFSFVVPTELLTGMAASQLREWLGGNFHYLKIDLFAPGSFPGVLQEVAVLSGRRRAVADTGPSLLTMAEHSAEKTERIWEHEIETGQRNWTRYLLSPRQLDALKEALVSPAIHPLGDLARFQVSVVTGANDFFSVCDETASAFELEPWCRPLLPRIRHAPGLIYSSVDHAATLRSGARGWLLDFADEAPDPGRRSLPATYLAVGEGRGLPDRYKCRIREPWYQVPHIERGSLLLSKRSHRYPRAIVNEAETYTTDTIYRGDVLPTARISPRELSASFHSSLTLLSAELEGRSFGGGVLELVPSEIEALAVARAPGAAKRIGQLDAAARAGREEEVVQKTDEALVNAGVLDRELVEQLAEARLELLGRRLARNERGVAAPEKSMRIAA